ncbi:MAG: tyrosine-type recombinase/integrase, partial [Gammaproteobacteria bacterium]|nr:tyrosine-type recombinase/integrase [Gammaproteobacteria bacterium]
MSTEHRLSKILNQKHLTKYSIKQQPSLIQIDANCPVYLYINGLRKKSSQATARSVLQSVARHLKQQSIADIRWANFDLHSMNQLIIILESAQLAPDTIVLYAAVIKGVLKKSYLLEQISQLHYDRVCSVNLPLGGGKKEHQIIDFEEFELFLSQFNRGSMANRRNMAIFSLLIGCGLRRFELTNLMISNLDLVNNRLRFRGKGGKVRQVAMHQKTVSALQSWLDVRGTNP